MKLSAAAFAGVVALFSAMTPVRVVGRPALTSQGPLSVYSLSYRGYWGDVRDTSRDMTYKARTRVYEISARSGVLTSSSAYYWYQFITRPRTRLPRTLTFTVTADDFHSFQISASSITVQTSNIPNHYNDMRIADELVTVQGRNGQPTRHWCVRGGTYFRIAQITHHYWDSKWRVQLTPAAMRLLQHRCVFAVATHYGPRD